jgi:FtsH-binding integral membrane protein
VDTSHTRSLTRPEQDQAIKTWRYLRLAMIGLTIGLLVSVVFEWRTVSEHCFQESISAYYYTPVRGYFVAALLGIGLCMFCLKGSREVEDVLLNLAGMFAAVVALVPTSGIGECTSLAATTEGRLQNIENNVTALIAVGLFGLLVFALLAKRDPPQGRARIGYAAGALLWAVAALVFAIDRERFAEHAHDIAAYAMFICILGVVAFNALGYRKATPQSPKNPYTVVFVAMLVSAAIPIVAGRLGWDHWVIGVETSFIVVFAIFWGIQTKELWNEGLRPPDNDERRP